MVVVCHFLPLCSLLFFSVEICFIIQRGLHLLLVSISGFCPLPEKLMTSTHPRAKFQHPSRWIRFFLFSFLFLNQQKPHLNTSAQRGLLIRGQALICLTNSNAVSQNCGVSAVFVGVLPACRGAAWEKVQMTGRSI